MSETRDRRKPALIVAAGFIGGLGAWVWAVTVGPSPLLLDPVLAIPSYIFLGVIAGFLGVYLIAKTDPAQTTHAIAFSLACGLFRGTVISGAEAIFNRSKVEQASRDAAAQQLAVGPWILVAQR
jgi:1,4-dihydroxy-2-naphthoate octaprenyltransferase